MLFNTIYDTSSFAFKKHKSGFYYYYKRRWYNYDEIVKYPTIPIPFKIAKDKSTYQFLKVNGRWSRKHRILGDMEDYMLSRFVVPSIIDYMDRHQIYFSRLKLQHKYIEIKEDTPENIVSVEIQYPKENEKEHEREYEENSYQNDDNDMEDEF